MDGWMVLWSGMVSHWLSHRFLEFSPRNSFSNSKQHYPAALGFGALLRPTSEIFAVQPRAPEVVVHFAHRNRGYSLFLLLVPPQPRSVHSRWLAPLCGMGFLCR